jgi:hypothetical protein
MAYRQTNQSGPDVYDYDRGSYGNNSQVPPPPPPPQTVTYQHQQQQQQQDKLRKSDYSNSSSNKRFNSYQRKNNYKYNFFSLIDEPWNRCCEVGSCGTCPGNNCISTRQPKLDWL